MRCRKLGHQLRAPPTGSPRLPPRMPRGSTPRVAVRNTPYRDPSEPGNHMVMSACFILVLGERNALAWVVREQRMAFAPHRFAAGQRLQAGDHLFLYATRGAFHNPTRDRGRIFGEAEVSIPATVLQTPLELGGRVFTSSCNLQIRSLAPMRQGVELAPLVPQLSVFPDLRSWPVRLRRPLVPISSRDAAVLRAALVGVARDYAGSVGSYGRA